MKDLEDAVNKHFGTNSDGKDASMRQFAARLKPEVLMGATRDTVVYGQIAQKIIDEIESHWDTSVGSALKCRLKLSWDRYQRAMNILCQRWDQERGRYVDRKLASCRNVRFPQLRTHCSKGQVKELHREMTDQLNIVVDHVDHGDSTCPLETTGQMSTNLDDDSEEEEQAYKRQKSYVDRIRLPSHEQLRKRLRVLLKEKRVDQRHPLEIQLIIDSAGMHRGVKQTTASLKIVTYDAGDNRETNNSPVNNKRVLMYEGEDNYEKVSTYDGLQAWLSNWHLTICLTGT